MIKKKAFAARAETLNTVEGLCNTFFLRLTTETNGNIPLNDVLLEEKIALTLRKTGYLLLVKIHKSGGSEYIHKNMITLLIGRKPPVFYMGGVVASFLLVNGSEWVPLRPQGFSPIHGGFEKVHKIKRKLSSERVKRFGKYDFITTVRFIQKMRPTPTMSRVPFRKCSRAADRNSRRTTIRGHNSV